MAVVLAALSATSMAPPAVAQSLTDRFKSLFGGGSDDKQENLPASGGPPADPTEGLTCPPVNIRAGASTYAVAMPGKQAVGNDVRFQASITKTARECNLNGNEIIGKIGIQGRVVAGPAGAPATVDIPMRIAVVQGGIGEKVIATKAYRTTVQMTADGSVPFTIVAEDMVYPVPPPGTNADNYVFYIGFDPQALTPERGGKKRK
ncbi:hypothetical protein [Bradyrhizobium sp. STM 3809]|uniref:hypothetical protein n=1 Tax=Bradyrhizobium sp. STM 3809 TaxID=551936 RepID=UPI0002405A8E|nr:hypothetical protein [Bradyrhizobium sp. STM 3809]CCD99304.1 conserved exported hypothetical protein [Bradyrhizobium sp. STM 3809]